MGPDRYNIWLLGVAFLVLDQGPVRQLRLAAIHIEVQSAMARSCNIDHALFQVNEILRNIAQHRTGAMTAAINHHLGTVGKMVRARLLLTIAAAYQYTLDLRAIHLAAAVELAHNATLLHDDVLDHSLLRRDKPTLNAVMGNKASILFGDYLVAQALEVLTTYGNSEIIRVISMAVSGVLEGELQQHVHIGNLALGEIDYLRISQLKTGQLFAASAEIAAILVSAGPDARTRIARFGLLVGTAFQLADDYMDYAGAPKQIGKPVGSDFRRGIATLPIIKTLERATQQDAALIAACFGLARLDEKRFAKVLGIIGRNRGLQLTTELARQLTDEAINSILAEDISVNTEILKQFANNLIANRLAANPTYFTAEHNAGDLDAGFKHSLPPRRTHFVRVEKR